MLVNHPIHDRETLQYNNLEKFFSKELALCICCKKGKKNIFRFTLLMLQLYHRLKVDDQIGPKYTELLEIKLFCLKSYPKNNFCEWLFPLK